MQNLQTMKHRLKQKVNIASLLLNLLIARFAIKQTKIMQGNKNTQK